MAAKIFVYYSPNPFLCFIMNPHFSIPNEKPNVSQSEQKRGSQLLCRYKKMICKYLHKQDLKINNKISKRVI